MITVEVSGSKEGLEKYLRRVQKIDIPAILANCGAAGVKALSSATPAETGLAANSWSVKTFYKKGVCEIVWSNSDIENGFPVVIMLQYGHGTGTGGYVQGIDFINPAMRPVFDDIANKVWKAVISA